MPILGRRSSMRLGQLSPEHRAVLTLRFVADLSEHQTAEALGIPARDGQEPDRTSHRADPAQPPEGGTVVNESLTRDLMRSLTTDLPVSAAPVGAAIAEGRRLRGRRRIVAGVVAASGRRRDTGHRGTAGS